LWKCILYFIYDVGFSLIHSFAHSHKHQFQNFHHLCHSLSDYCQFSQSPFLHTLLRAWINGLTELYHARQNLIFRCSFRSKIKKGMPYVETCVHLWPNISNWNVCQIFMNFGIELYKKVSGNVSLWKLVHWQLYLPKGINEFLPATAIFVNLFGWIWYRRYQHNYTEYLWVLWKLVQWNAYFLLWGVNKMLISTFFIQFG
jgi:hypothetical protein